MNGRAVAVIRPATAVAVIRPRCSGNKASYSNKTASFCASDSGHKLKWKKQGAVHRVRTEKTRLVRCLLYLLEIESN